MKLTQYLILSEVIELHRRTIEEHGGKTGVRDKGLLESALLRCQSGYYETFAEQAAALLQSLCMNHCFIDGNKRVALLATVVFLKLNGFNLKATNQELVSLIINDVIINKMDVPQLSQWLGTRLLKK